MKENGKTGNIMGKEHSFLVMVKNMKENGSMV